MVSFCTDLHCIKMVESGVHKDFLQLLKKHNGQEGDVRLQHALISALRNLAIPASNKAIILKDGALEILTPMINCCTLTVAFKLLASLRMLVDGQGIYIPIYTLFLQHSVLLVLYLSLCLFLLFVCKAKRLRS